jgi:hypothetical protein
MHCIVFYVVHWLGNILNIRNCMHGMSNIELASSQILCHTGILAFNLPCQLFFYENWILNFYIKFVNGRD